jgi:hypothetical protein
MTPTRFAFSLAVVLAGCTTRNQNGFLEILRVTPGTFAAATATTPASCTLSATGAEVDFLTIDLSKRFGQLGVVVQNALVSNAQPAINRLNTNDFIAEQAVLSYEIIGGGTAPPMTIAPAQGVAPAGATSTVATFFFPQTANLAAAIPAGKTVRVTFHIEGKLTDGSSVRTNEYEYVFITCASGGTDCSSNQCL